MRVATPQKHNCAVEIGKIALNEASRRAMKAAAAAGMRGIKAQTRAMPLNNIAAESRNMEVVAFIMAKVQKKSEIGGMIKNN